jgi:hypothetical protein
MQGVINRGKTVVSGSGKCQSSRGRGHWQWQRRRQQVRRASVRRRRQTQLARAQPTAPAAQQAAEAPGHVRCGRMIRYVEPGRGLSVATKTLPQPVTVTGDCGRRSVTNRRLPVQEGAGPLSARPPLCRSRHALPCPALRCRLRQARRPCCACGARCSAPSPEPRGSGLSPSKQAYRLHFTWWNWNSADQIFEMRSKAYYSDSPT